VKSKRYTRRARAHDGQASLELLATVPAMVVGAMIAIQLAITGYSLHLADGAAEAAALAAAAGTDPEAAAVASLPGWAADAVDVRLDDGLVEVSVRPPAPHPAISAVLKVSATAWARPSDDG
jgi:hypothetical protein